MIEILMRPLILTCALPYRFSNYLEWEKPMYLTVYNGGALGELGVKELRTPLHLQVSGSLPNPRQPEENLSRAEGLLRNPYDSFSLKGTSASLTSTCGSVGQSWPQVIKTRFPRINDLCPFTFPIGAHPKVINGHCASSNSFPGSHHLSAQRLKPCLWLGIKWLGSES